MQSPALGLVGTGTVGIHLEIMDYQKYRSMQPVVVGEFALGSGTAAVFVVLAVASTPLPLCSIAKQLGNQGLHRRTGPFHSCVVRPLER